MNDGDLLIVFNASTMVVRPTPLHGTPSFGIEDKTVSIILGKKMKKGRFINNEERNFYIE